MHDIVWKMINHMCFGFYYYYFPPFNTIKLTSCSFNTLTKKKKDKAFISTSTSIEERKKGFKSTSTDTYVQYIHVHPKLCRPHSPFPCPFHLSLPKRGRPSRRRHPIASHARKSAHQPFHPPSQQIILAAETRHAHLPFFCLVSAPDS